MPKLHELVAVEKDLKTKATKLIQETAKTFTDRQDHFVGMSRTYDPIDSKDPEKFPPETKIMVTTVAEKLSYFEKQIAGVLNTIDQKERANCVAKASIVVEDSDGNEEILVENVPVTVLVQLENYLEELRGKVYNTIPTYDPTKVWTKDPGKNGVYINHEPQKNRTRKGQKAIVLYPHQESSTGQFLPAQTQLIGFDEVIGYFNQKNETGMLSPKEKSEILIRLDNVIQGVKKARARANEQVAESSVKLGDKIFKYLSNK